MSMAPRKRGRPANPSTRPAILTAARELLEVGGLSAVTIDGIARRARVSRPTIYRYWPHALAVAMDAVLDSAILPTPRKSSGSPLLDLGAHLRQVAQLFTTRTGRSIAAMVAAAEGETELSKAFRNHFIMRSREEGRRLLLEAITRREARSNIDLEAALDLLYAPLYFRLLMGHGPLNNAFIDAILEQALHGLTLRKRGR